MSRPQARFLTAALLLLSVGSVATARGAPVAWGWQFAAFQSPAIVFLGAVGVLGLRRWGDSDDDHRQFAILMLGLLGFAFLACTIRIGAYAMRLEPALYAVPVMLGAIAAVIASRRLAPYDPDVRRLAWIRFGGYVLTGLAFALALSPPRTPSAIFSANTVAASLLGFALYAAALRRDRHPAFLYLAIAALVAARVGAHYFLAERIRIVIDHLRRILGYSESLPWAYLSLLGLIVNPALAGLSLWFRRGWKDRAPGAALPLHRPAAGPGRLPVVLPGAEGGGHRPVRLRRPLRTRGLAACRPLDHVRDDRRTLRSGILRFDTGSRRERRRPGTDRGRRSPGCAWPSAGC